MGWLLLIIPAVAAVLLFRAGRSWLGALAVLTSLGSFWSWWTMHQFATLAAKRRSDYTGGFYDLTDEEVQRVPDWITWVCMGLGLLGVVLLIFAFLLPERTPAWAMWFLFLVGYLLVFIVWSHVPIERFDRHVRWMNPIGRPMLNALVLTGLPALYAYATDLPGSWALVPLTLVCTQYAVLVGRFIMSGAVVAGIVSLATSIAVWIAFYTV